MPHTELNWFRDEWDENGNHVEVHVELRYISPLTIQRALTKLDKIKKELRASFHSHFKPEKPNLDHTYTMNYKTGKMELVD